MYKRQTHIGIDGGGSSVGIDGGNGGGVGVGIGRGNSVCIGSGNGRIGNDGNRDGRLCIVLLAKQKHHLVIAIHEDSYGGGEASEDEYEGGDAYSHMAPLDGIQGWGIHLYPGSIGVGQEWLI